MSDARSDSGTEELVSELRTLIGLAKDTRVSAEAIGMRISNNWPQYEEMIAALSTGFAQQPAEPHETTYLRGWNEAAERAAEIAESNGWEATADQIRGLLDHAYKVNARGKLSDPHPHWSAENKNENYPKTVDEWNPHKDPVGQHLTLAVKRLRMAMDRDDPRAPDQMALISRWDLTTLVHDWWHKSAVFEIWRDERAAKRAADEASPLPSTEGNSHD
jgi:hypothetical protein